MKAHRRMLAVAAMALSATLIATPAFAGDPQPGDVEIEQDRSSSPSCEHVHVEGDHIGGIGLLGLDLSDLTALIGVDVELENVLNCTPILSDIHVLSNEDND